MTSPEAQPQSSLSAGIYQTDTIEKETYHQEMEDADMAATPPSDEDPDAGKLNKEIVLAYIVGNLCCNL